MEVVAGGTQSYNKLNDFIKYMESAASAASFKAGDRFSNFTVDRVSCESAKVWLKICKSLSLPDAII